MNDNYLWDRTGEPDTEVQFLFSFQMLPPVPPTQNHVIANGVSTTPGIGL